MKTLPPILIVTDRGHFIAYQLNSDFKPQKIDETKFAEGNEKLSEQVTDRAGGFPNGGSKGQGNSAAERMTLVAELEMRCFRHIAERIISVLEQAHGPWAFAAPSEINGAILDGLPKNLKDRLKLNLTRDLTHTPATQLCDHFLKAREHAEAS